MPDTVGNKPVTRYDKYARGNFFLIIALIISVIAALASVVIGVIELVRMNLLNALVFAPLCFFLNCALATVFHRVRGLGQAP